MRLLKKNKDIFFLIIIVSFFNLLTCTDSTIDTSADNESVNKFIEFLKRRDFTVQEGEFISVDMFSWVEKGFALSCIYNNANSPYKTFILPPAPTQTVKNLRINNPEKNLSGDYKIDKDEVLIFIGKTPPKAAYFSFGRYLMFRYVGGAEKYKRVFVTLGDELNNLTINAGKTDDPFEKEVVIIITGDKNMDLKMRDFLQICGFDLSVINSLPIPADQVKLGLDEQNDNFAFLHRINAFENESDKTNYMNSVTGRVFRITPNKSGKIDPFTWPTLRQRGNGTNELYLKNALDSLQNAIIKKYSNYKAEVLGTHQLFSDKPLECLQNNEDPIGACNDTPYIITSGFTLDNSKDEFIIAFGVNHVKTNKSSYSNISIYGQKMQNGVIAVFNKDFKNSAAEFISENGNNQYLYAWKFSRIVQDEKFYSNIPFNIGVRGINLDEIIEVGFRAYLEKSTKTGPSYDEILWDRVIRFSKK